MTLTAKPAASDWIEIFRAGDYRDKGKALITRDDLDRIVRNYDPSYHEAPVTVGHPEHDQPAYGWIDRLALNGDVLLAKEKQVDPQFDEARKAGRYKKRSAAFYQDTQGRITGLRHVAYLGAQPPEVKGLKNVNFEDDGRTFLEFVEEEAVATTEPSVGEQIKAFFAEMFSPKSVTAPGAVTFAEADVKRIVAEAVSGATAPLQAKIASFEAQFAETGARQKTAAIEQRVQAAIQKLRGGGKWLPAFDKMGMPLLFTELAKIEGTVEFGEGDAKTTGSPLDLQVAFLEKLPKFAPFTAEVFTGGQPAGVPRAAEFTEGRAKASSNSIQLDQQVRKRMADKSISYSEALSQVSKENPELTAAGGSSAGEV